MPEKERSGLFDLLWEGFTFFRGESTARQSAEKDKEHDERFGRLERELQRLQREQEDDETNLVQAFARARAGFTASLAKARDAKVIQVLTDRLQELDAREDSALKAARERKLVARQKAESVQKELRARKKQDEKARKQRAQVRQRVGLIVLAVLFLIAFTPIRFEDLPLITLLALIGYVGWHALNFFSKQNKEEI